MHIEVDTVDRKLTSEMRQFFIMFSGQKINKWETAHLNTQLKLLAAV